MLLATLKALILAGKETLQDTVGLPVVATAISQVRQGRLTFPALGELQIRSGTLQRVNLGCDQALADRLARGVPQGKPKAAMDGLAKTFLTNILREMEGRNPRGRVAKVGAGSMVLHTRGVRTFGVRLATSSGQLFLLAEIPSRIELENAKGSDFAAGMMSTYLPRDWMNRESLDNQALIDSLLILLQKLESDIHLEIPRPHGEAALYAGVVLEQRTLDGLRALKLSADLQDAAGLVRGAEVRGTVGLEDRSLDCTFEYLGPATHPLVGGISLSAALFTVPETFEIAQRRKAFRIPVSGAVSVDIAVLPDGVAVYEVFQQENPVGVKGKLADLSFSGARVVLDGEDQGAIFKDGQRVMCRMVFPDEFEPLDILALVRRATKGLANRNEWQDELGLEFLVCPDLDRRALDCIRQYVLSEQRSKLAHRILVARPT